MKITINQIKNIIEQELRGFLEKEKETCRDEYLDCGDTVPCFDDFLECEEEALFKGMRAFTSDKKQKEAELVRIQKKKQEIEKQQQVAQAKKEQEEIERLERQKQAIEKLEAERLAELEQLEQEKQQAAMREKEKQAEFDRMNREEQERIAKGIYNLYKFVDEQGGYVSLSEIPEDLYQFLDTAEMEGNILDVSDEFESYSLGDAPGGYEEKKQERESMKKLIQVVFDEDKVPDWAVERKEDGSYYWINYEQDPPETIDVPRDLEDLLDLD